jgi:hypothetical protein
MQIFIEKIKGRGKKMSELERKQGGDSSCGEGKVPDKEGGCVMPEVTFFTFVMSLNTSVLYHLGQIADPVTGEKDVNLEAARHGIDTLVLVQNKTKGNLTRDEEEMLKNIIYDIKLRFVKEVKK